MIPSPLWQLDLSGNELCGLDEDGDGDYTAEGIIALAEALKVNGSLASVWAPAHQPCPHARHDSASAITDSSFVTCSPRSLI